MSPLRSKNYPNVDKINYRRALGKDGKVILNDFLWSQIDLFKEVIEKIGYRMYTVDDPEFKKEIDFSYKKSVFMIPVKPDTDARNYHHIWELFSE